MKGGISLLELFVNYWLQWILGVIAAGIGIWARRYIRLEKESINRAKAERMKEVRAEIVKELEEKSDLNDKETRKEIENLHSAIENINTGLLSVQGKNFRDTCIMLLKSDHEITIEEYEQFEEDHIAYKALKGNHKGDALYDRVVEKFNEQIKKGTRD